MSDILVMYQYEQLYSAQSLILFEKMEGHHLKPVSHDNALLTIKYIRICSGKNQHKVRSPYICPVKHLKINSIRPFNCAGSCPHLLDISD